MSIKAYLNRQFAKKLLVAGGVMHAVSLAMNFITAFSVYGKVDECLDRAANCKLGTEQFVAEMAMVIGYAGIGVLLIGLVLLLTVLVKNKK